MNFVAHIGVAVRSRRDCAEPMLLVGSALPDFAAMARTRLRPSDGPLGNGVALHHASDHAFHTQHWFLEFEHELRALLLEDGLPDGAARACAHVGPELLLDGALVDERDVASGVGIVYEQIAEPSDEVVDLAPDYERDRWREHLVRIATRVDPFTYRDPAVVAHRLHAITSLRPRLAFDDSLVRAVADRMRDVQPRITSSATSVLQHVVRAVAGPTRRVRSRSAVTRSR